jgi:hypothetical protein
MTATPLATKRLGATGLEVTRLRLGGFRRPDHDPILSAAELTDQHAAELEGSAR